MNTHRTHTLSRWLALGALVAASTSALAGDRVYWSVSVNAPLQGLGAVGTTISNTRYGVVAQPQVHYAPAPVVYAPPAVIVQQRPVYVQPRPVYVAAPVAYCPPRAVGPWGWRHRDEAWARERHERQERMAWGYGRGDERYERGDRDGARWGDRDGR